MCGAQRHRSKQKPSKDYYLPGDFKMTLLEKKQEIMQAFASYSRWIREGKPKYRDQYYYDNYHSAINSIEDKENYYTFSIQLYDGPDGDTWWMGEFKTLNSNTDIEILRENYWRS